MTGPATPEVPDAPDDLQVFDAPPPIPGSETPELAYAEQSPADPRVAHPAARAFAFVLDGFATFMIVVIIVFGGFSTGGYELFWAILLVPLGATVLDTILTATKGITPAKAILGLRVVDADTGFPIGIGRSILRSLVIVAPIPIAIVLTIFASVFLPWEIQSHLANGFAFALFVPVAGWMALLVVLAVRPRHRGLQDLAGRSVVVPRLR